MSKSLKRLAIAVSAVALVGAFVAATLPVSEAIQSQVVCDGDKDHLLQPWPDGPTFPVHTTGFLAADILAPFTTPDGRNGTNLKVADVFSTGNVEGLGRVTFALDRRAAGGSSIVANQKEAAFPATQTMRFHFTTTIDGKSYRSISPAVVTNSEVSQFPPASGTVYVLTNAVKLEDASQPGTTAFVLQPGKAFTVRKAG